MGKLREIDSEEEFHDCVKSSGNTLVVVDFWASWCGPCRMIGPHFDRYAEDPEFDGVIFLKIDVDEVGDLAEEMQIQCMPTFMFFKNGEKVDEMSGANKDKLKELIQKHK